MKTPFGSQERLLHKCNRLLWHTSNQVHHPASEVSVGLDADTNSDKGVVVVHCEADADEGVVDDEADADAGFDTDESVYFTATANEKHR